MLFLFGLLLYSSLTKLANGLTLIPVLGSSGPLLAFALGAEEATLDMNSLEILPYILNFRDED